MYALTAPLLYNRVQTTDLCHLLEGTSHHATPIPGLKSKRELIDMVETIILLYPTEEGRRSYLTQWLVEEYEAEHGKGSVGKLKAGSQARVGLATKALEEAVVFMPLEPEARMQTFNKEDEGKKGEGCIEGQEDAGVELGNLATGRDERQGDSGRVKDVSNANVSPSPLQGDREHTSDGEDDPDMPFGLEKGRPAFTSLKYLSIGSNGPRNLSHLPDARSRDARNIICPTNVCIHYNSADKFNAKADPLFFPGNAVLQTQWEAKHLGEPNTGIWSPDWEDIEYIDKVTVHIDPACSYDYAHVRPVPAAGSRPCVYLIDNSNADALNSGRAEEIVCAIVETIMPIGPMYKLYFIGKMPPPVNKDIQWHWDSIDEFFSKRHMDIFEQLYVSSDDEDDNDNDGNEQAGGAAGGIPKSSLKAFQRAIAQRTTFEWDLVQEFPQCEACGRGKPGPINKEWYKWGFGAEA